MMNICACKRFSSPSIVTNIKKILIARNDEEEEEDSF